MELGCKTESQMSVFYLVRQILMSASVFKVYIYIYTDNCILLANVNQTDRDLKRADDVLTIFSLKSCFLCAHIIQLANIFVIFSFQLTQLIF